MITDKEVDAKVLIPFIDMVKFFRLVCPVFDLAEVKTAC